MPFVIGVYLSRAKLKKPEFLALQEEVSNRSDVALRVLDIFDIKSPDTDLDIDIDIILHKVTDDLIYEEWDEETARAVASYEEWYLGKKIPVVESMQAQRKVLDRVELHGYLDTMKLDSKESSSTVYFPKQVGVPQHLLKHRSEGDAFSFSEFQSWLQHSGVSFPFICKTSQACGCPAAHSMAVVGNAKTAYDALRAISKEFIDGSRESGKGAKLGELLEQGKENGRYSVMIQEYVPHASIVHKVYVLGESVWIQQRESLPDCSTVDELHFHSHKMAGVSKLKWDKNGHEEGVFSQSMAESIAKSIKDTLDMRIFGFDVLVTENGQNGQNVHGEGRRYAIIDVNYFPGFKGVEAFPRKLIDFLKCTK